MANKTKLHRKLSDRIITLLLAISIACLCHAQSNISYDRIMPSTLKDDDGNSYGKGGISIASGQFNMPLSFKMNEKRQPTIWSISLNAKYGVLDNSGEAKSLNPDEIINTSMNLTHMRPINDRWSMIASLGAGIYAMPDDIRWRSILANGGVFFVYRVNNNLKLGAGGGMTNSYGAPIIMPMVYVSWDSKGKYELNLNFTGRLKVSAATNLSEKFRLELTAIEMDGMSAVMKIDGHSKIYSATMMKSYISPVLKIDKHFSLYAGLGADWRRTANIRNRKLKDMFNFNHSGDRHFATAWQFTTGLRYSFR